MTNYFNDGKVAYVEPNAASDFTAYDSVNMGQVHKSVDLEDMCVVVGLEVEVKGRDYLLKKSGNESTVIKMTWQNNLKESQGQVSFMEGSKISTVNNGVIQSLTTNYTDIHLFDLQKDGTMECFGIKSVDISYNNFMVPEVEIQFVDVRGVSLFAQEEMRHNLTDGNMDAMANNGIDGSFFKCFFTFPYPKFTLFVKGFYGEMASYELTCSDFRAAFDSNTGNFNVRATFVGYAFSFLNDIMVTGLVSAPYCEYLGKQYWESETGDYGRFHLTPTKEWLDAGGETVLPESRKTSKPVEIAMPKLGYICTMYREVQKRAAEEIQRRGYADLAAQAGFNESQVQTLKDDNISDLKVQYQELMNELWEYQKTINNNPGDSRDTFIIVQSDDGKKLNDCCIVTDNYAEALNGLKEKFTTFNQKLKNVKHAEVITTWVGNHEFYLQFLEDFDEILNDKSVRSSYVSSPGLRKAIEDAVANQTNYDAWTDGDNSEIFIYQDFGLKNILGSDNEVEVDNSEQVTYMKQKIEQGIINKTFHEIFGFEPSVENITKIIMAHVETWVYVVTECAKAINGMGQNRSVRNLNISLDQLTDIGPNTALGADMDTIVSPFPKVTRIVDKGGVQKEEDAWIGSIEGANVEYLEEIKIVEGLLNGVALAAHDIEKANMNVQENGGELAKSSMPYPLTYFDFFIHDTDSVWGKDVNPNDVNDLFARFGVRAFSILATQGDIPKLVVDYGVVSHLRIGTQHRLEPKQYGKLDAKNFLAYIERNNKTSELATLGKIIQSLTKDQVWDFLVENVLIDKSKKSVPWGKNQPLVVPTAGLACGLNLGRYKEGNYFGYIFPIKNWTFNQWSSMVKGEQLTTFDYHYDYVTSLPDQYGRDSNGMLFDTTLNINYFTNSIQALREFDTDDGKNETISRLFDSVESLEWSGWNDDYDYVENSAGNKMNNKLKGKICFFNTRNSTIEPVKTTEAVEFNNGKASLAKGMALNFYNFFWRNSTFERQDRGTTTLKNEFERATDFIQMVFLNQRVDDWDFDKSPFVKFQPRFAVLKDAIDLSQGDIKVRPAIKKRYMNRALKFVKNEFKKIEDIFGLGLSLEDIKELKKELSTKLNNGEWPEWTEQKDQYARQQFRGFYERKGMSSKWEQVDKLYKISTQEQSPFFFMENNNNNNDVGFDAIFNERDDYGGVYLIPQNTPEMAKLVKTMFEIVAICPTTQFSSEDIYVPTIEQGRLKGYFEGFIEELRGQIEISDGEVKTDSLSLNADPDDIKVGVYNYIKLLYDKWISSGEQTDFYRMETLFQGEKPTFQFIDSMYNKIGKTMYVNLSTLVERVYQSQSQNGYTLLSLLSALYADNKFLFLCIQNFLDLSKDDMISKMFKPIPYIETNIPDSRPTFVVLMPYEASSKLDVQGADYPDDGFYLNNENDYPEMIRLKEADGMPIPAFGVSYGQQYQNYFKDINVNMETPMVTEQSIKAKFMIANASDGSDNNGMKLITAGQDLYTIYANNSYTCTVTMMGCAWVQPMMYFVLQNVPMFRGSYMIVKVTHQITPGNMTTTFKGVRMKKTATRSVEEYLLGSTIDSYNGGTTIGASMVAEGYYAGIDNDCAYAYYSPVSVDIKNPTQQDKAAYCYLTYTKLRDECGLTREAALGVCAAFCGECNFNPSTITIDGNPKKNTRFHVGGGLAGFFHCGGTRDSRMTKLYEFNGRRFDELQKFDEECLTRYQNVTGPITDDNYKKKYLKPEVLPKQGIYFPFTYDEQMAYLCNCIEEDELKPIKNMTDAHAACRHWVWVFGLGHSSSTVANLPSKYDRWVDRENFGGPSIGEWVTQSVDRKTQFSSKTNVTVSNEKTEDPIKELAKKLCHSFQKTLSATKRYNGVQVSLLKETVNGSNKVGEERMSYTYYQYKAVDGSGKNLNDILFDVILQTYDGWFDRIRWDVGTGSLKSEPKKILVRVVDSAPKKHKVMISSSQYQTCPLLSEDDIHEGLKLSLMKYFKKKNITKAQEIKSVFTSAANVPDNMVEEVFNKWTDEYKKG